ncbi:AMP-binding protein [Cupriavidus necator]
MPIHCGEVAWSYAEFDALCDRPAIGLNHNGIAMGSRMAEPTSNSHAFAAMCFALERLGAVIVPINTSRATPVQSEGRRADGARAEGRGARNRCRVVQHALPGEATPEPAAEACSALRAWCRAVLRVFKFLI